MFRASEPGVFLAFHADGMKQYSNVPSDGAETSEALEAAAGTTRSVRYSQIVELRVAARGAAMPELIVGERSGERRTVRMRAEDLERLQRTLNRVDAMLPPAPRGLAGGREIGRVVAAAAAVAALAIGQSLSVAVVALIAAWRPTARLLLAAATAAIVTALSYQ